MFSHSVTFSNINTKRRSFATFSVIVSVPLVTSASLQSLSLNLLPPACLLNSLSLLLADIDKKDLIFFWLFHTSSFPLFAYFSLFFIPLFRQVSLVFFFPFSPLHQVSSAPVFSALCRLLFIFSSPSFFFSFLCLHHHSLFPDSLAPWALWYCCHGDAHHFLAWMEDTLLMRRQSEREREKETDKMKGRSKE